MKLITQLAALVPLIQVVYCQEVKEQNYEILLSVVDDAGKPVRQAATVTGSLRLGDPIFNSKYEKVGPIDTDAAGIATLKFRSLPPINGGPAAMAIMTKQGYYDTKTAYVPWQSDGSSSWKAQIKAVLKPVKNPIPMAYHPSCGVWFLGQTSKCGFDLEMGEAVAPHGKGKVADIEVVLKGTRVDNGPDLDEDIDYEAQIQFPNPLDGFTEFPSQPVDDGTGSIFISDYEAPTDGYVNHLLRKGEWGKSRDAADYWEYTRGLEKKGYYFRVRTKTDSAGKITQCHYGKIYGPVKLVPGRKRRMNPPSPFEAALVLREVYFNPTPSDRNIECDTKINLLGITDEYGMRVLPKRP